MSLHLVRETSMTRGKYLLHVGRGFLTPIYKKKMTVMLGRPRLWGRGGVCQLKADKVKALNL